jgi:hypothetical protein
MVLCGQLIVTGEDFERTQLQAQAARRLTVDFDQWFTENPDWRPYADLVVHPPMPEELMKEFSNVSPEVLARCLEFVRECGGSVTRGAIYVRVRREGEERGENADKWATMLCLNAPPGVRTTDTFWAGRKHWTEVFGEKYANKIKQHLAHRGVSIRPTDEYMPELARFPGDPQAIVPFGGARSYIKNLCESRGWACDGAVNVEGREPDEDPYETAPRMDEKLVRQKGRQMVEKSPELGRLPREELRARVLDKFGPSKAPRKHLKDVP